MSILLTHAYVVTVDTDRRVIPDGWILIEGNLITGIGSCATDPLPSASEVIDLKGMLAVQEHGRRAALRRLVRPGDDSAPDDPDE